MCLAKHLTVLNIRAAPLAPCRHMVSVHFIQFPDTLMVGIVANGAMWAVGSSLCFCLVSLLLIDFTKHCFITEESNVQQFRILTTAKHELEDTTMIGYIIIVHQLAHFLRQFCMIVCIMMETLI